MAKAPKNDAPRDKNGNLDLTKAAARLTTGGGFQPQASTTRRLLEKFGPDSSGWEHGGR